MKKLLLLPIVAILFAMGLTSCTKCEICTKDSEPELRVCESDYTSNTAYGFALDWYEAGGYTCKSSF